MGIRVLLLLSLLCAFALQNTVAAGYAQLVVVVESKYSHESVTVDMCHSGYVSSLLDRLVCGLGAAVSTSDKLSAHPECSYCMRLPATPSARVHPQVRAHHHALPVNSLLLPHLLHQPSHRPGHGHEERLPVFPAFSPDRSDCSLVRISHRVSEKPRH